MVVELLTGRKTSVNVFNWIREIKHWFAKFDGIKFV